MKQTETESKSDRREWITRVLRRGALAGIGVATVYLAGKQLSGKCPWVTPTCQTCQLFARCDLSPAQQVRERSAKEQG